MKHFLTTKIVLLAMAALGAPAASHAATATTPAATPPMGWNDWAHYQCDYTADTILANAKALIATGLAAAGYDTVTIDDCWMAKRRDAAGNLRPNARRFPNGIAPVARAVHGMGLRFGIYEDAGSTTCGGFAGSGEPVGGGDARFLRDVRLFASWGVDYLKLDGCNVYVPPGATNGAAYRKAYVAASVAIAAAGRPIVFSESAPAYFQGQPAWYDVLAWVGRYGQLWREGSDIQTFDRAHPAASRFHSVLWNYAYNLPLGRYQKPGQWDDPDFIIGGDEGMTLPETRSQLALWAMMSAPLILGDDVTRLDPEAVHILGNRAVIAVDQDRGGAMATLVRRTPATDTLVKPLAGGDYAVAAVNRGAAAINVDVTPRLLGFAADAACTLSMQDLWTGITSRGQPALRGRIGPHDAIIWRIHTTAACGPRARNGAIVMTVSGSRDVDHYGQCLADTGVVHPCAGTPDEAWTVTPDGALRIGNECLSATRGGPAMRACVDTKAQRWAYRRNGNLVNAADDHCLGATGTQRRSLHWVMQPCGDNAARQIWALPNPVAAAATTAVHQLPRGGVG